MDTTGTNPPGLANSRRIRKGAQLASNARSDAQLDRAQAWLRHCARYDETAPRITHASCFFDSHSSVSLSLSLTHTFLLLFVASPGCCGASKVWFCTTLQLYICSDDLSPFSGKEGRFLSRLSCSRPSNPSHPHLPSRVAAGAEES